jgi:hypothetical protein
MDACLGFSHGKEEGRMLHFTVIPPGHEKLHVRIYPEQSRIETNIPTDTITMKDPKMCNKCQTSRLTHTCNLLQALVPILVYFSDFLSFEKVVVEYEEQDCSCRYVETAQRAGFILCLYAMFHSSCDYFSQFNFILKYYRVNITYEIFMHLMLTTAVLKRQVDLDAVHDKVDLFAEVKAMAAEFRNRLTYILEDARAIEKKDAAVNALNIIFSLNSLSADYLREFYKDFLKSIKGIHPLA